MLTCLIADDEPLARTHLRRLLEEHSVRILGEAENGVELLALAEDLCPHLVFLDIQMPGMTGVEIARALVQLNAAPLIIFVTAYSEFAVDAFDHAALDYLVKPVSSERLAKTLVRARERLSGHAYRKQMQRHWVLERAADAPSLQRLPVRAGDTIHLLRIEQISWAQAKERRVYVATPEGEYRTYFTLTQLETLMPEDRFIRIHDSWLVNIYLIEDLHFLGNHSYVIRLSNGALLPVGRTRYTNLQQRLGIIELPAE